ncbi:hypothetical protein [Baekduia sp. Peel2402]|uniref:hypothetical protein n=1 Tax=Baekduia sp. Peel2402 TaxID=3458296 RepID=UPI00403E9B6D
MRRDVKWLLVTAMGLLAPWVGAGGAQATTWSATTANVVATVGGAAPGDVVQLASGTYGTVHLTDRKTGIVTVKPASGATVTIDPELDSAAYLRFEGFTGTSSIGGFSIYGTDPSHIEIVGNRFTAQSAVDVENDANTGVLIDSNTFDGIDACATCKEGRLNVYWAGGPGTTASGVTVSRNHFGGGGCSDGLQVGAYGVAVADNVFENIHQGVCSGHIDSLQLYGQSHTSVTGNLFTNFDTAIMSPDGGDTEIVTDNVFDSTAGSTNAIQFGSVVNSTFAHNTVRGTAVNMDTKGGGAPNSTNGIVRDNVMVNAWFNVAAPSCTSCSVSYNLFDTAVNASGSTTAVGTPTFVGGANPSTAAGFALTAGSPGKGTASDGLDRGIRIVDTLAPETSISSTPTDPTTSTSASFSFSSSDAGSTFECKLDGGAYSSCTSAKSYTSLSTGSHTFMVRATDAASHVDPTPSIYTWTINAGSITAPTFISENEVSSWTTTGASKSTASFAVQAGDVLVAYGMTEDSPNGLSISGGSLTWTQQQLVNTSSYGRAYVWTATASSTTSITVTFTRSGSGQYGGDVLVFRGSGGIGASSKTNTTGAPSLALTTTQANSAIVVASVDWNAVSGSSRTWRTGAGALTETTYSTDPAHGTFYGGYHASAGAAGSKTVGLSAPSGQQYSIVAVEVKGT